MNLDNPDGPAASTPPGEQPSEDFDFDLAELRHKLDRHDKRKAGCISAVFWSIVCAAYVAVGALLFPALTLYFL